MSPTEAPWQVFDVTIGCVRTIGIQKGHGNRADIAYMVMPPSDNRSPQEVLATAHAIVNMAARIDELVEALELITALANDNGQACQIAKEIAKTALAAQKGDA